MDTPIRPAIQHSFPNSLLSLKNDLEKILLSQDDINQRIGTLGLEIDQHYQGSEILLVTLLDVEIVFVADLIRNLTIPLRLDCIKFPVENSTEALKPRQEF